MFLFRKLSGRSSDRQDDSNIVCHDRDDISKQALEQASEYVNKGDYEEALWILERLGTFDPAMKGTAELAAVAEVCNAAVLGMCSCSKGNRNPDWYKILKVDEKSDIGIIKKQYRNLALLLHPDKNKHMKAEAAFKLVSEAYACLSDKRKREIFNVRRSFTKCKHCTPKDCAASGSDRWHDYHVLREQASLHRPGSSPDLTQMDWALDQERLKRFRARARSRVLGNLERVCKERGFTGLKKTSVLKEVLDKHLRGEIRKTTNLYGCKVASNDANQKKQETPTDNDIVIRGKHLDIEDSSTNAAEQENAFHQQLAQPCKSLGALIRDLQIEYLSAAEREEVDNEGQGALKQELTPGSKVRLDMEGAETDLQDGQGRSDSFIRTDTDGDHMDHASQTIEVDGCAAVLGQRSYFPMSNQDSPSAVPDFVCSDNVFDGDLSAWKNDEPRQRTDEGFMESEAASVMECQELKHSIEKDFCRMANKPEEDTMQRKENLHRQPCQNDNLHLQETILRTQREKSEQLLRTLQRLRDETRTVAASLNHLYFARS